MLVSSNQVAANIARSAPCNVTKQHSSSLNCYSRTTHTEMRIVQTVYFARAAEARNRLRIMRLRYQSSRAQEISHLIACQPTALKAVRLQALVPSYPDTKDRGDAIDKLDRERVENFLEDAQGLLTNRIN